MLKASNGDINSLEDRLWALANTVSIEEHAISSYLRTHDAHWLETAEKFRAIRKRQMEYILGKEASDNPAEIWCITKHALGAAMRYSEVAARYTDEPEHMQLCLEDCKECIKLLMSILGVSTEEEIEYFEETGTGNAILATAIKDTIPATKGGRANDEAAAVDDNQKAVTEETETQAEEPKGFLNKFKDSILRCCRE